MTKQEWMTGVIGLLIGIVVTVGFGTYYYSSHHNGASMSKMMQMLGGQDTDTHHESTCDATSCKVN